MRVLFTITENRSFRSTRTFESKVCFSVCESVFEKSWLKYKKVILINYKLFFTTNHERSAFLLYLTMNIFNTSVYQTNPQSDNSNSVNDFSLKNMNCRILNQNTFVDLVASSSNLSSCSSNFFGGLFDWFFNGSSLSGFARREEH